MNTITPLYQKIALARREPDRITLWDAIREFWAVLWED